MTDVCAIFLGGTIGFASDASEAPRRLAGEELLGPQVTGAAQVEVRDLMRTSSSSIALEDVELVLSTARESTARGIVVVQGTDTMEETAFLLDLLWDDERPLVLTGAMRKPTALGADGPANLAAAVTVASGDELAGAGAVVVMNDEIHAARFVRKTHPSSVATFASPVAGPLGRVVEGRVRSLTRLPGAREVHAPNRPLGGRVPIVTAALGDDDATLRAVAADADGLVVAAMGGGHVPASLVPALAEVVERRPVVLSSRTGAGPVLGATYGGPGSETDLLGRGLTSAHLLDPLKARLLLLVALACDYDRDRIGRAFDAYDAP